jgi:hypothetical protein
MPRPPTVLLLLLALCVGGFLWWWSSAPPPAATGSASPTVPRTTPTAATPGPAPTPPPFRLAGVAVGTSGSYAVIEDPHGVTALYRVGDQISGLGRLAGIERQEVLIETESGPVALRLRPAPTHTPADATPTAAAPEAEPASTPAPSPADNAPESSP